MTIGQRLRIAREAKLDKRGRPLSRSKLAEQLGRTEKTIYNWENGFEGREPSLSDLQHISRILGRSVEWLRTGEDEPARIKPSKDDLIQGLKMLYLEGELSQEELIEELYLWQQERKKSRDSRGSGE